MPQKIAIKNWEVTAVTFSNRFDNKPKPWQGLVCDLIGFCHVVRTQKDGAAFSLAEYIEGATRGSAGVKTVHGLVLEYDHLRQTDLDELKSKLSNRASIIYSTFSHQSDGPDDNCLRVILPLSRSVMPPEYRQLHAVAGSLLGDKHDPSPKDVCRLFYLPSCPPERPDVAYIEYRDGEVLDVDEILATAFPINESCHQTTDRSARVGISPPACKLAPFSGLFNVFSECEAFAAIKQLIDASVILKHDQGLALFHLCMAIEDGVLWFTDHTPGWPVTQDDVAQLRHSIKAGYRPWSCQRLQEKGLCPYAVGSNPCLNRRDPAVSRSPFTFAFGKKSIKKVIERISKLAAEVSHD